MKVAAIGDNCIDVYERIGKKYPTGNVVDTGVNIQKLGIPVSVISTTGSDENGVWMVEALTKEGLDLSHFKVGDGATAITYMDMDGLDRVHGDYVEGVLENIVFDDEDIRFAAEHDLVHTALWGKAEDTLPKIKALSAQRVFGGLSAEEAQQYQTLYHEQGKLESEMEQIQKLLDSLPRGQKEALDKLDDEIRAVNDKITAAKACQSERAALLFAPVQMHRAGLKLYEPMKESGELRDVFKLTWDGRDYVRLSLSERVRCGLEVVELLSRLSGKSYPLFVDNTESLCDLGAAQHGGQMILARVVPRQTLQVKALDEPQRKAG